jgi:DNA-binding NarL/FixJ family response regulator/signal transduction histidine kinase
LAAGCALLAFVLRILLEPILNLQVPFLTFFAAVVASTWYGGLGPGVLAIALSAFFSRYCCIPPYWQISLTLEHLPSMTIFLAESGGLLYLTHNLRQKTVDSKTAEEALRRSEEELRRSERLMSLRARQQGALAALGITGLRSSNLQDLLDEAVALTAETLDVELCKALELLPASNQLHLRAGIGWQEGLVGHAMIPGGDNSQAGYTLTGNEPVVVEDLRVETRFNGPALLHDHGVVSGLSCIIWTSDRPWGVLGVHSTRLRHFTQDDIAFLQGIANVLAASIQRHSIEHVLKAREEQLGSFAGQLEHLVTERTGELLLSQERLRALATELNLAEQRERKRLATELHDYLQQMLVLGKLKLGQGKRLAESAPHCYEVFEQTDQILSDALAYTRTLAAELSPPVLRDHGLGAGLKWLGNYMQKHNLAVTVAVPDELDLKLPEDQVVLLFQSVRELLMNSLKHSGAGRAAVIMQQREGHLQVEVSDEGKGFDHTPVDAAEESSAHSGISSKFGLFSIQERMRALGGSFKVHSEVGSGTIATLSLPLLRHDQSAVSVKREPPLRSRAVREAAVEDGNFLRVVLVDDHAMVRQGLRSLLTSYPDVEIVAEAADGIEAVSVVEEYRPNVVIMDINMPKMDGIEATARIKARYPHIAVVGLSVNTGRENQEAMLKAGAAILLTKEAAVERLYDVIQNVMTKVVEQDEAHILLIDGNEREREYYAERLRSPHYVVRQASTAASALAVCKSRPIDCVVLELDLPDMSGLQLLVKLVSVARRPEIATIVLTRVVNPDMLELAKQNGALVALQKSATSGDVLQNAILKAISTVRRDSKRVEI